ncbi:dihydrodipicolinate synthase family protein [Oleiharenicola lentus]|uniref:dihydrodipicolinate synthase family protein n=1 Tax=Oleiharenicola lentus TaxID=2508720 RepID=UPI003F67646C
MKKSRFRLDGLIAAPFTPFDAKGAVNYTMVAKVAAHLRATGVHGAFVCGTTGEGSSLTSDERRKLAETWRRATKGKLKLIVHVGHNSLRESQELAKHAQSIGADAVATLAPSFFKPEGLAGIIDWCAAVAKSAPKTPFYYYHMPGMTGVNGTMADFLPLAAARIPNFAGIKFTHENLMDYTLTLAAAKDRYDILFGRDEILLSALVVGAPGAVGSTYNYMAPIFNRVVAAYVAGDLNAARAHQLKVTQVIASMVKHGGLPAGKAIMSLIGLDCGSVRAPLVQPSADSIAKMRAELEQLGFFTAVGK